MKWSEITKDSRYKSANADEQFGIKEDWYSSNIKTNPRYTPEQDPMIREDIFGKDRVAFAEGKYTTVSDIKRKQKAREAAEWASKEINSMFPQSVVEQSPGAPIVWAVEQIERPFGGLRAIGAGNAFLEGFKNPREQPSFVDSAAKSEFATRMGVDQNDVEGQMWVNGLAGWALDLGSMHLIFNVAPKVVGNVTGKALGMYTNAQGKAIEGFKSVVRSELEAAGMSKKAASDGANVLTWKAWNKAKMMQKTPGNIAKTTKLFTDNKGKLGEWVKAQASGLKTKATSQGFTPEVFKRIKETGARSSFGKLIEGQILAKEAVPLHPAQAGKEAMEAIAPNIAKRILVGGTPSDPVVAAQGLVDAQTKAPASSKFELTKPPKGTTYTKAGKEIPPKYYEDLTKVEKAKYIQATKKATVAIAKRKFPFKATSMGKTVTVLGPADRFEPYKSALKGKAEDPTQLMTTSKGKKSIRMASQLTDTATGELLIPKHPPFKEKRGFEKVFTEAQSIAKIKQAHLDFLNKKNAIPPKPIPPETLDDFPALASEVLDKPQMHSPESVAKAKSIKSQPLPEFKVEAPEQTYDFGTWYNIEYQTPTGARETMMNGDTINSIVSDLQSGKVPKDSMGTDIYKINKTFGMRGRKAQLNLEPFEDAIRKLMDETKVTATDVAGGAEYMAQQISHHVKKYGTPFMIGQKYPKFKPVYMGVQNAVDYKAELFFEGARILDPNKLRSLPQVSKNKIVDVLKLGNSSEVGRYFHPEELAVKFGFNPKEIAGYNAFKRTYDYGLNIEVKSRALTADLEEATPDQQSILKENIKEQLARRGGYVSQSRGQGKWAVYSPPEIEAGEVVAEGKAKFFNLYDKKSEALKVQKELGEGATVYMRSKLGTEVYKNLTMADLESLIEASDVDTSSSVVNEMRNTLRKRTFGSHWIKRENIPGYKWDFDNVLESAINYLEGSSNKLSRITGRRAAETAFKDNVKGMTPEIRAYSRDFINGFYNSGSIGFRAFNRTIYAYKLAFKLSWLAQNLTQPIATTYPTLAKYFTGTDVERVFGTSYGMATRYLGHRIGKGAHGLSTDLISKLNKLHRQGVLGDQLTRFQLGARNLSKQEFDKWIGLFGRLGEGVNRTHAAICGYRTATEKLGLTDKQQVIEFMKEFVYKTQFAYGKQNLPLVITGAGNMRNMLRTMYTFKSYIVNYLQMMNGQMPWRGAPARQSLRTVGTLLAQAGMKGLPFAALISYAYKKMTGRTMDTDAREAMLEAGVPNKVIDVSMHGAYSTLGIDASNLIGVGDAVPTMGSTAQKVGGAGVGWTLQMSKALWHLKRGEYGRAMENASPDALRNVLKATRYAQEGVRKVSGELITTPSKLDVALQGIGFTSIDISKAYLAKEAKTTLLQGTKEKSAFVHQKLAEAMANGDEKKQSELHAMVRKYNETAPPERQISINFQSIMSNLYKRHGIKSIPVKLRQRYMEIEKIYGTNK